MGFAKCMMITFNVLLVMLGLALAICGLLFYFKPNLLTDVTQKMAKGGVEVNVDADRPAGFLAAGVFGCFVFLMSLTGLVGAAMEQKCPLITYIALVVLILLASIGLAGFITYGFASDAGKSGIRKDVENSYVSLLTHYYNASTNAKDTLDKIQKQLECCGCNGPADFTLKNITKNYPPGSADPSKSCNFKVVGICLWVAVLIEILAIVFAGIVVSNANPK